MKKDRFSLAAGFAPVIYMGLAIGFEHLLSSGAVKLSSGSIAAGQAVMFALPMAFLLAVGKLCGRPAQLRVKKRPRRSLPFVIFMSLTAMLAAFLLNCLISSIAGSSFYRQTGYLDYADSIQPLAALLTVVILPALLEELLFRGALLSAFESGGTSAALLLSALAFALAHGNIYNLAGPFAAGLIYGYMTYVLDSVWPAVLAQGLNNLFFLLLRKWAGGYETLGFWPYFILISFFVFCAMLHLSMHSLEKLVERGKIKRFAGVPLRQAASELLLAPGIWLLAAVFIVKALYLK